MGHLLYGGLLSFMSMLYLYGMYKIADMPGLIITGFGVVMFTLGYFRWELHEMKKNKRGTYEK